MSNRVKGQILPGTYIPFAGMNVRRSEEKEAQVCGESRRAGNNSPFGGVMKLSLQGRFGQRFWTLYR